MTRFGDVTPHLALRLMPIRTTVERSQMRAVRGFADRVLSANSLQLFISRANSHVQQRINGHDLFASPGNVQSITRGGRLFRWGSSGSSTPVSH